MLARLVFSIGLPFLLVLLITGISGSAAPANLAPNPSFEVGTGNAPAGWSFDKLFATSPTIGTWDGTFAHSGSRSLKTTMVINPSSNNICNTASGNWESTATIPIQTTKSYLVSVWHFGQTASDVTSLGGIGLLYFDAAGINIPGGASGALNAPGGAWTQVTMISSPSDYPAGAVSMRIILGQGFAIQNNSCPVGLMVSSWFDDLEILEIPATSGTAMLSRSALQGATTLEVSSNAGFTPGDQVIINPGGASTETALIKAVGSLVLQSPLKFNHAAGELVVNSGPLVSSQPPTVAAIATTTATPLVAPQQVKPAIIPQVFQNPAAVAIAGGRPPTTPKPIASTASPLIPNPIPILRPPSTGDAGRVPPND